MKPLFSAVLTAALALASVATQAQEPMSNGLVHELRGGILAHDVDHLWSGFSRESGADLNIEAIFTPRLEVLDGTLRPALGASLNTAGDTSKIYLGGRWQYDFENGLYASAGLGAAYHNGESHLVASDRKALGSSLLFHIPLEIGYYIDRHNALSLYFDHISNAYTQDENEGLDTLGLRYGYRF
jgi:lipid A 3-O-deacylase